MTNLKEVNFGENQYCVPSALSILTGRSTDYCASLLSEISGKSKITKVQINHTLEALKRLGYGWEQIPLYANTLFGMLNYLAHRNGIYFVRLPFHIVAIEVKDGKIYFCDNHTKEPINAQASARLTQRVVGVYKVKEIPKPKLTEIKTTIVKGQTRAYVYLIEYYDDETSKQRLGATLNFESEAEFKMIAEKLNESTKAT